MIKTNQTIVVEFEDIVCKFCELTNWSSAHLGAWNADLNKSIVFHPELMEQTCQHEQDWMCFYYPENYEDVTVDEMSLLDDSHKGNYSNKDIYVIPFGAIIRWLTLKNELPNVDKILVIHGIVL